MDWVRFFFAENLLDIVKYLQIRIYSWGGGTFRGPGKQSYCLRELHMANDVQVLTELCHGLQKFLLVSDLIHIQIPPKMSWLLSGRRIVLSPFVKIVWIALITCCDR